LLKIINLNLKMMNMEMKKVLENSKNKKAIDQLIA
jgi:hypothetical protein